MGFALGTGGANVVLGLLDHTATRSWMGGAFLLVGVVLAGVLVRRRLSRGHGDSPLS
jgi:hypothetical protein